MTTKLPSKGQVAIALMFALSVFGFTLFVWRSFGGTTPLRPKGYQVHVLFPPGGTQLVTNADVRIAGVRVGKVRSVAARGLRTDAQIELERQYAPLASDARAILRPKTLLGETFVQITSGSRSAPKLPEGGTLPIGQVERTQSIDRVLSTFDAPTREAFRDLLKSFAASLNDRGVGLNATFGSLEPTTVELRKLVATLSARDRELRGIIRDGGVTLRAVGAREDALRRLVTAGDAALAATDESGRDLTETIRELPPTLREARATLAEADAAAADAAPTLRALRPVAPLLLPALRETEVLVPKVARTIKRLPPVIDAAKKGLPAVDRVVRNAGPLMVTLRDAGRDLVPVVEVLEAYRVEFVASLAKTSAAIQGTVLGKHYLRAAFLLFNESFVGFKERLASNRRNTYQRPGALKKFAEGLESLDCSNVNNPQSVPVLGRGGAPPCKEQGPWTLRDRTALLPSPRRDPP